MTLDLAIRPVAERARAHQIVVLAETEPVLNLPAGKARFDDMARHPVRIVDDHGVPLFRFVQAAVGLIAAT